MEPAPQTSPTRKPRLALAIATCFGLGYIPKAPGTVGSLAGVILMMFLTPLFVAFRVLAYLGGSDVLEFLTPASLPFLLGLPLSLVMVGACGVWASGKAARYYGSSDPQVVVVDEISGQQLALTLGGSWFISPWELDGIFRHLGPGVELVVHPFATWKYLLLGLILFRVFDIWKPFPVRQAEKLPGGWGIMADDWVAGIYAALGLWVARALGM